MDDWLKAAIAAAVGGVLALIAAVATGWFSFASKDKELRIHLVEIAIGILRADPSKEDVAPVRNWAMDAIDQYSGLRKFTTPKRDAMTHKPIDVKGYPGLGAPGLRGGCPPEQSNTATGPAARYCRNSRGAPRARARASTGKSRHGLGGLTFNPPSGYAGRAAARASILMTPSLSSGLRAEQKRPMAAEFFPMSAPNGAQRPPRSVLCTNGRLSVIYPQVGQP